MEIVLVLAFLGIIISGVFPVFINSIEANKSAEYYSKAYKILDSKIEEYRNADFNTLSSSQFDIPELPGGQGTFTVSNTVEGAPQNDIKQVNLVVHWDFKRARQVESSTYMSRGGIKK
jgi:type II secretory pathway pseudopilin PulG